MSGRMLTSCPSTTQAAPDSTTCQPVVAGSCSNDGPRRRVGAAASHASPRAAAAASRAGLKWRLRHFRQFHSDWSYGNRIPPRVTSCAAMSAASSREADSSPPPVLGLIAGRDRASATSHQTQRPPDEERVVLYIVEAERSDLSDPHRGHRPAGRRRCPEVGRRRSRTGRASRAGSRPSAVWPAWRSSSRP